MSETRETMVKRLHMRSMRRGIKEMDLILSSFANDNLPRFHADELALYDRLLSENDHDIYGWITGQLSPPPEYGAMIAEITKGAEGLTRPD